MTGLDCTIIMHPQVWKCSGHHDLFHDYMVDCRQTKKRYRYDQVRGRWVEFGEAKVFVTTLAEAEVETEDVQRRALKFFKLRGKDADRLSYDGDFASLDSVQELDRPQASPGVTQLRDPLLEHADVAGRQQGDESRQQGARYETSHYHYSGLRENESAADDRIDGG